ncbi:hypothetical protein BC830DRAFT_912291 [Chytriomyces sp. MP71]|nr:hypothetical protein BC830DRAFT_912291 [Chytriomyces sp. MP71]
MQAILLTATFLVSSVVAETFCAPSQFSCQIQSDPFVNTFTSTTTELHTQGWSYALNSNDMNVQVHIAQASRNGESVLIVDQVMYTCGDSVQNFNLDSVPSALKTLSCNVGSCAGTTCTLTVVKGQDPVPNVSIQEIRYFGTTARGGVCFDKGSNCPGPAPVTPQPTPVIKTPSTTCTRPPAPVPTRRPICNTQGEIVIVEIEIDVYGNEIYSPPAPGYTPVYNPPVYTPRVEPAVYTPRVKPAVYTPRPAIYTPKPDGIVNTPVYTPTPTPKAIIAPTYAPAPVKVVSQSAIYSSAGRACAFLAVPFVVTVYFI